MIIRKLIGKIKNLFFYKNKIENSPDKIESNWMDIHYIEDTKRCFGPISIALEPENNKNNSLDDFFQEHDFLKIQEGEFYGYVNLNVDVYPGLYEALYKPEEKKVLVKKASKHTESANSQEFMELIRFDDCRERVDFNSKIIPYAVEYIDTGIDLTHGVNNYWHVFVDIAPKLLLAKELGIPNDIPALVPDTWHKNFIEIIRIVAGDRKVQVLPGFQLQERSFAKIHIKKLYSIGSIYSYHFHPIRDIYEHPMHSEITPAPVKRVAEKILDHFGVTPEMDNNTKLIIVRNSDYRVSSSQKELIDKALSRGYTIFEPEKHSFEEQVRTFAKASSVVSFFGAAVTNTLFMHSDARKILFANPGFYFVASFWNAVLNNAYILKNGVGEVEGDDGIHGEPYLTDDNWNELQGLL